MAPEQTEDDPEMRALRAGTSLSLVSWSSTIYVCGLISLAYAAAAWPGVKLAREGKLGKMPNGAFVRLSV